MRTASQHSDSPLARVMMNTRNKGVTADVITQELGDQPDPFDFRLETMLINMRAAPYATAVRETAIALLRSPVEDFDVSLATHDDIEEIVKLTRELDETLPFYECCDFLADLLEKERSEAYLIRTKEGVLIGCAVLSHEMYNIGMISHVFVAPELRKRGIGSWLVRSLIRDARLFEYEQVSLYCKEEKMPFYLRLGFRHSGFLSYPSGCPRLEMSLREA